MNGANTTGNMQSGTWSPPPGWTIYVGDPPQSWPSNQFWYPPPVPVGFAERFESLVLEKAALERQVKQLRTLLEKHALDAYKEWLTKPEP